MGQAEPTTWMPAYGVVTEPIDRDELADAIAAAGWGIGSRGTARDAGSGAGWGLGAYAGRCSFASVRACSASSVIPGAMSSTMKPRSVTSITARLV